MTAEDQILARVPPSGIGVARLRLLCRGLTRTEFVDAVAALVRDSRVSLHRLRIRKITKARV